MPTRKRRSTQTGQPHGPDLAEQRILGLSVAVLRVEALAYALEQELPAIAAPDQTTESLQAEALAATDRMSTVPITRGQAYFTLMLGCLHEVAEKWQQWRFADPAVDGLLSQTGYVQRLREYRHAVFHEEHYDREAIHHLFLDDALRAWTAELTAALGAYCRHWHAEPAAYLRQYLQGAES